MTSYTTTFIISSALVHAAFSQSLNSVPQLNPSRLSQSQSMEAAHSSQSVTLGVTDNNPATENIEDSTPEGIHWGDSGAWGEWITNYQDRNDEQNNHSNTGRIEGDASMDSYGSQHAAHYRERLSSDVSDEQNNHSNTGLIEGQDGDLVIPTDDAGVSTRPGSSHGNLRGINDNRNTYHHTGLEDGDLVIPTDDADVSTRPGGFTPPTANLQLFIDDECTMIEQAIGIEAEFGVMAHCECSGDLDNNNMEINCAFDGDVEINCAFDGSIYGTEAYGHVVLNFAFGDPNGIVESSFCATFDDTNLEDTFCIDYEIDIRDADSSRFWVEKFWVN